MNPYIDLSLNILAAVYLVEVILNGDILAHAVSVFYKEKPLHTREELMYLMMTKSPRWLFNLLHCPLCLSFHIAWVLALLDFSIFTQEIGLINFPVWVLLSAGITTWLHGKMFHQRTKEKGASEKVASEPSVTSESEPLSFVNEKWANAPKEGRREFLGKKYVLSQPDEKGRSAWVMVSDKAEIDWADAMMEFFESPDFCKDDPECWSLRAAYTEELAVIKIQAEKDSKVCSPCQINGLKDRYFRLLKRLRPS